MKQAVSYNEHSARALEIISRGAFLTSQHQDKTNVLTIGWGSIGFAWRKPVFMAMIRTSRYSHELVEGSGEFTISIPFGDMRDQLALCGSRSGRDTDKFAAAGLKLAASEKIQTPVIDIPGLHYECKVVCKQQMTPETTGEQVKADWYSNNDFHTLYFAEIVASYVID